jgi:hypothetical protein
MKGWRRLRAGAAYSITALSHPRTGGGKLMPIGSDSGQTIV